MSVTVSCRVLNSDVVTSREVRIRLFFDIRSLLKFFSFIFFVLSYFQSGGQLGKSFFGLILIL